MAACLLGLAFVVLDQRVQFLDHRRDLVGHGGVDAVGLAGTHAGDLISEVALAIEMGADSVDIGKTIHPHPTLGESVGLAAEAAHGHCTDLPPVRKR